MAATVYYVWQERNKRIFSDEMRTEQVLCKIICDEVRSRLVSLKTIKSTVMLAAKEWDV